MTPVLVDTGPLYAMVDQDDGWHERVSTFLTERHPQMVVPITVLPEVCYLIATHLGAHVEVNFVRSVARGEVKIEFLQREDVARSVEIMSRYADVALGFVDASVVAVAERLKLRELMTTDRRHFTIVRPRHCASFQLLP